MNLVIDIGNTCTKLVIFEKGKPLEEKRIENDEPEKVDEFCKRFSFDRGIYSSVIGINPEFKNILDSQTFRIMEFKPGKTLIPILNKYETPETLGSDRLAAAVGANYLHPDRMIMIIDVGTCVTYDFVNERGEYLGGNISPGPTMRLKALDTFTSQLPLVDRKGHTPDFGTSTETAIRSGVMNGVINEIEGYISKFSVKYPSLFIYLTEIGRAHV